MSDIETVIDLARSDGNLTRMFSALKPLVSAPLDHQRLGLLTAYFARKDAGLARGAKLTHQQPDLYAGPHGSYQEWFTRDLRPAVLERLRRQAQHHRLSCPVECVVESVGRVADPSSIIRLKKPADYVNAELIGEGVPPTHLFVNMKLLTSHYHHVRAPCAGVVKRVMSVPRERAIFGRASLTYVVLDTAAGDVALMIVGEAVVQDFALRVRVGQSLAALDDLGNFRWGSQVVLLAPGELPELQTGRGAYHFVGDALR